MSTAKKILTAIQDGRANVEQFYDGAIVEPGYKGSEVVIKGSALFSALTVSFASAPELAALSMGSGSLEAYAVSALSSAMMASGAWIGLATGAAALSHLEDDNKPAKPRSRLKP